jgi:hypothetical protein
MIYFELRQVIWCTQVDFLSPFRLRLLEGLRGSNLGTSNLTCLIEESNRDNLSDMDCFFGFSTSDMAKEIQILKVAVILADFGHVKTFRRANAGEILL